MTVSGACTVAACLIAQSRARSELGEPSTPTTIPGIACSFPLDQHTGGGASLRAQPSVTIVSGTNALPRQGRASWTHTYAAASMPTRSPAGAPPAAARSLLSGHRVNLLPTTLLFSRILDMIPN